MKVEKFWGSCRRMVGIYVGRPHRLLKSIREGNRAPKEGYGWNKKKSTPPVLDGKKRRNY